MQKIAPFFWFEDQAEEAAKYYVSIFKKSKIKEITRYGEMGPGKPGSVMTVDFQLEGQDFTALNGGKDPAFKFTPAISLFVSCKTQKEIDHLWEKLLRGGSAQQCGWLTDKYGITWQIVPENIGKLIEHPDAMKAMLGMVKLDIQQLEDAAKKGAGGGARKGRRSSGKARKARRG